MYFIYHFTLAIVSKEHSFSKAQGTYELKAVIFHIGYTAERGHYTVATVTSKGEIIYYDDWNVFRLEQAKVWADIFNSHQPFNAHNARCRPLRRQPPNTDSSLLSVGEQPRTPYLLVYASTFQKNV